MDKIRLFSDVETHETYLELWGSSTNHPDCTFEFSKFNKVYFLPEYQQIFNWLLECASTMNFHFHAFDVANFAMEIYKGAFGEYGGYLGENIEDMVFRFDGY